MPPGPWHTLQLPGSSSPAVCSTVLPTITSEALKTVVSWHDVHASIDGAVCQVVACLASVAWQVSH